MEIRENTLDAFGPILIKKGYDWVDLDEVAEAASLELPDLSQEFTSKALLCESWMERTDERAKKHHQELLSSGEPMRQVLETYFDELESFMSNFEFSGCPFTNTARAIRGKSQPGIEQRVKEHKAEIRRFFLQLCSSTSYHPEILGEALFLIYSGATTESANNKDMKPIKAGRQAGLALFDLYAA